MNSVTRRCVWETNSSMTHSVVILTAEEDERWGKESLYYYDKSYWYDPFENLSDHQKPEGGRLYSRKSVLEFIRLKGDKTQPPEDYDEDEREEWFRELFDEYNFISYEDFTEDEYCENDTNYYTTPGGENIVVHCKYGRDG